MHILGSQMVRGALLTVFISLYFLFLTFTSGDSLPHICLVFVPLCHYNCCLVNFRRCRGSLICLGLLDVYEKNKRCYNVLLAC